MSARGAAFGWRRIAARSAWLPLDMMAACHFIPDEEAVECQTRAHTRVNCCGWLLSWTLQSVVGRDGT